MYGVRAVRAKSVEVVGAESALTNQMFIMMILMFHASTIVTGHNCCRKISRLKPDLRTRRNFNDTHNYMHKVTFYIEQSYATMYAYRASCRLGILNTSVSSNPMRLDLCLSENFNITNIWKVSLFQPDEASTLTRRRNKIRLLCTKSTIVSS